MGERYLMTDLIDALEYADQNKILVYTGQGPCGALYIKEEGDIMRKEVLCGIKAVGGECEEKTEFYGISRLDQKMIPFFNFSRIKSINSYVVI